jgi:muconolactone D-isomerase
MLFQVEMDVRLPHDMPPAQADELKRTERELAQQLQRDGKWRHLWRIAGRYANVSIFDVASHDELHTILSSLPLFPFMTMTVTALCRHPSSVREDDR